MHTLNIILIWWCSQGRNEGEQGDTIPRAPNHYGGAELLRGRRKARTMSQVLSSTAYLFPKDCRFKHGDAKLVHRPGRRLTSLCLWV